MTSENINKGSPAAWKELLTPPAPNQALVLAIFFFASCLVLPLANDANVATAYMVACVFLYYGMNRSLKSMLHYALPALPLLLLSAVLPVPTLMMLPCAYITILVGGSCGAFLLTHYHKLRHVALFALAPAAAYGAAFLLLGVPFRPLLALMPAALALAAGLCLICGTACKDAVVTVAAALIAVAVAAGVITLAVRGELHGNVLKSVCTRIYDSIISSALKAQEFYYEQTGVLLEFSETELAYTVRSLINLAPGLILALAGAISFLLWRSLLNMLTAFDSLPRLPVRIAGFAMGRMAAVVFLLGSVVSLLASSGVVSAVCDNLTLALSPGLALIGCIALFSRGKERSCLTTLISIGLIALLFIDIFSAVTLASTFGAITVLTARFLPDPRDNNKKGE